MNGKKIIVGSILESKYGKYKVLELLPNEKMKIKFLKSGYETECFRTNKKTVRDLSDDFNMSKYKVGQVLHSDKYGDAEIIKIFRRKRNKTEGITASSRIMVMVKFLDTGYITECEPCAFSSNKCRDYLKPNVYGVGILGYIDDLNKDGRIRDIKEYRLWSDIIYRCYGTDYTKCNKSYINAEVEDRWKRFDYFYDDVKTIKNYDWWKRFCEEYPNTKNIFEIDKDMIIPNNKLYSRETCMFIPKYINAGYTIWAKNNTKENYKKYLEGLDYDTIIGEAKQYGLL